MSVLVVVLALSAGYHCPVGQLWRVHLDKCVSLDSPLARPYWRPSPRPAPPVAHETPAPVDWTYGVLKPGWPP